MSQPINKISTISSQFVLFSDGGGWRDAKAGAACIVRESSTGKEIKVVSFLGGATNNESEIIAALLGYSLLRVLKKNERTAPISIHWVSDSEYTLKSGTEYIFKWQRNGWKTTQKEPVKNQGFWRAFLYLTKDFRLIPEHVRGHAGHEENEACDVAASWAQEHGIEMIHREGDGIQIQINSVSSSQEWHFIDGREFVAKLRNDTPAEEDIEVLVRKFEELQNKGLLQFGSIEKTASLSVEDELSARWRKVVNGIKASREDAHAIAQKHQHFSSAEELVHALDEILRKLEKA